MTPECRDTLHSDGYPISNQCTTAADSNGGFLFLAGCHSVLGDICCLHVSFGIPFYNQEVYGKRNPCHSMNIILALCDAKSSNLLSLKAVCLWTPNVPAHSAHFS